MKSELDWLNMKLRKITGKSHEQLDQQNKFFLVKKEKKFSEYYFRLWIEIVFMKEVKNALCLHIWKLNIFWLVIKN